MVSRDENFPDLPRGGDVAAGAGDDVQVLADAHHPEGGGVDPVPVHLESGNLLPLLPGVLLDRHGEIRRHHLAGPVLGGKEHGPIHFAVVGEVHRGALLPHRHLVHRQPGVGVLQDAGEEVFTAVVPRQEGPPWPVHPGFHGEPRPGGPPATGRLEPDLPPLLPAVFHLRQEALSPKLPRVSGLAPSRSPEGVVLQRQKEGFALSGAYLSDPCVRCQLLHDDWPPLSRPDGILKKTNIEGKAPRCDCPAPGSWGIFFGNGSGVPISVTGP